MVGAKKILLVDDDIGVLNSLNLLLDSKYEILTATNGLTALNLIARQNPDIILLDLKMPDIDGETLLLILSKNEKWKHLPVIVISGYEGPSKALYGNIKGFLGKPVNPVDLIYAINKYC